MESLDLHRVLEIHPASEASEEFPEETSTLESLDHHLLSEILVRCGFSAHRLCELTCLNRKWKRACYAPLVWRSVRADGEVRGNLYGEGLAMITKRCLEMEELRLTSIHIMERPSPWMHHCLDTLLAQSVSRIRVLHLQFAWQLPFTDMLLSIIGRQCRALEDFTLSASNYMATDSAIAVFLRACPKVLHFRCFVRSPSPIHAPGDSLLWQIAKKWPNLITLEINGNHVTENGILGLGDCSMLESLSFHGYNRGVFDRAKYTADGEVVLFNSIRTVAFSYQLPTAAELRRLVRMCPKLSHLRLKVYLGDDHAQTLQQAAQKEFPELQVEIVTLVPPGEYNLLEIAAGLGVMIGKY